MADLPQTIEAHFVKQYQDNVTIRAQQMVSKLRGSVMIKNPMGEDTFFDQLGDTEAEKNNERAPKSPHMEIKHYRRKISPNRYHWGRVIDKLDIKKMLTDPGSRYTILGSSALGRSYDDEILTALGGTSLAVLPDESTTNVTLPSTQKVGIQVGSAVGAPVDANLNEKKVRRAVRIIEDNDVDMDLPENKLWGVMPAAAKEALFDQDRVVSSDFNNSKPLVDGRFVNWMGVTWIVSSRVPFDTGSTTDRKCYVWSQSGLGLGIYQDIQAEGGPRPDLSYSPYIYISTFLGATRLEEEKVVEIMIDETATATGA